MVCACAELSIVLAAFDSATNSTMPKPFMVRYNSRARRRYHKKMNKLREASAGPEATSWTGVELSVVECSGVEWSAVGWSGVGWSGVAGPGVPCIVAQCSDTVGYFALTT